jgi:hypothetical protein
MSRQIHRLTQVQVDKARPTEVIVQAPNVVEVPRMTAADFHRKHGVWPPHVPKDAPDTYVETPFTLDSKAELVSAIIKARRGKDRRAEVIAEKKFRSALKTMANPALVMRDGRPAIVKRKTRWLADGGSLWVKVMPSQTDPDACSKSFVFRYSLPEERTSRNGRTYQRQRHMGLGSCNTLRLDEAREKARECRKMPLDGIDPITAKRGRAADALVAEKKLKTWDAVVAEYVLRNGDRWSKVHRANVIQSLRDWISPVIGNVPISDVDTSSRSRP